METSNPAGNSGKERRFFGHPWPLATLFGMEVWERFSFYGMQAILLIYLYYEASRGGLAMDQSVAIGIVGAYGSSVYLATILGGWLADRVFGAERTLFYSGIVVMLGHIALAILPGVYGVTAGLMLVALGSGGVKATCSALVGALYEAGSPKRDAGFSIFYLGINIGGFVGPLLTGLLQQKAGFHVGFGIAAVGMAIGLAQYTAGRKGLPDDQKVAPNPVAPTTLKRYLVMAVIAITVLVVATLGGLVRANNLSEVMLAIIAVATVAYFATILRSSQVTREERSRVLAFIPLFLTSAAYWALYSQSYTVITAFFDQRVDRVVFGWEIPVGWLVSVQALTIILFSGVFAWLWTTLGKRQPSSAGKFVIAMAIIGATFLGYLPFLGEDGSSMPLIMLVLLLLGFTASELCLSPIGLSVTTKLAPRSFQTQMMALFFLSLSLGFAAGGKLGAFYTEDSAVGYFIAMAAIGGGSALLLALCLPFIRRAMRGAD
ncbi:MULTISPECIES: peptide MFS transporter [Halomonas]|uniref:peptide MFS transporter n=1 Tax=Halomonas TaxID=2745 RepID=UPI001C9645D7|nr:MULTISPECIES: oligopeptide:H+ symporter [Halomonas]MBY6206255.1 oligopeptide:H+ symporter [Halomonas sp. DP3Y7-2]MBY6227854.1 oligopeptide:H+ symporter [Halomonas sp. DP3Y7-1]MCA0915921.1 oligopeptide:H+ symporter [Halomonas denitrificans]